jgi:hypothetical protein
MITDFRARRNWKNFNSKIARHAEQKTINIEIFNYISKLEDQVNNLQRQIVELIRGSDDDVK